MGCIFTYLKKIWNTPSYSYLRIRLNTLKYVDVFMWKYAHICLILVIPTILTICWFNRHKFTSKVKLIQFFFRLHRWGHSVGTRSLLRALSSTSTPWRPSRLSTRPGTWTPWRDPSCGRPSRVEKPQNDRISSADLSSSCTPIWRSITTTTGTLFLNSERLTR